MSTAKAVRTAIGKLPRGRPFTAARFDKLGTRGAVDHARRRVTVDGNAVALTATEYELRRVLALGAGRVMTCETLLDRVWVGREGAGANRVRIFVRNLRRKLGDDAASPGYVRGERGVGYRLPDPDKE